MKTVSILFTLTKLSKNLFLPKKTPTIEAFTSKLMNEKFEPNSEIISCLDKILEQTIRKRSF